MTAYCIDQTIVYTVGCCQDHCFLKTCFAPNSLLQRGKGMLQGFPLLLSIMSCSRGFALLAERRGVGVGCEAAHANTSPLREQTASGLREVTELESSGDAFFFAISRVHVVV